MHKVGNKIFKLNLINLLLRISFDQFNVEINVGIPIVSTLKPKNAFIKNNEKIRNIEIGKLKKTATNGKIKFIPEKNMVFDPIAKPILKKDNKLIKRPITPNLEKILN